MAERHSDTDADQRRDAMLLHALRTPPQPRKKRDREARAPADQKPTGRPVSVPEKG